MNTISFALRTLTALLGGGFVALVFWAFGQADFFMSFAAISSDPWGIVSLADLYLGFFVFAVIIALYEGYRFSTAVWLVLLFCLGNGVAAAWLVWRWSALIVRMRA